MTTTVASQAPAQVIAQPEIILSTSGLTKRFGARVAVEDLSLEVRRGDVFALLGPNGSGKTTTLRMALGLVWPTSGEMRLFGGDIANPNWRRTALRRIGAVVEQPTFYPYLNARENLSGVATFAGLRQSPETHARIQWALDQVRLTPRANDAYKKYSLGMKQRLGIAAALLTDPEFVILDEPTNGLDPAGISEVRALIGSLARRGTTVLLSSHLLYEVQQVCTRVAIIQAGRMVAQGDVSDLLSANRGVLFSFAQPDGAQRAAQVLHSANLPWAPRASYSHIDAAAPNGWQLLVSAPHERSTDLNALLVGAGVAPAEVRRYEASLEQYFLSLTGGASMVHMAPAYTLGGSARAEQPADIATDAQSDSQGGQA